MIVLDTSAFVSLSVGEVLAPCLDEFEVGTTRTIVEALEATAEYDDVHGEAARSAVEVIERVAIRDTSGPTIQTSRIDPGEGTCVHFVRTRGADFLITDDFRALPELRQLVDARVGISPIVLRALVNRGRLEREEAQARLDAIAENRDWLERPIYRRAEELLSE